MHNCSSAVNNVTCGSALALWTTTLACVLDRGPRILILCLDGGQEEPHGVFADVV